MFSLPAAYRFVSRLNMNTFVFFITGLFPALLIGCAGNQTANIQKINYEIAKDSHSKKIDDLLLRSSIAQGIDPHADYIIGAEDLLEVDVFQADELRRTVRVSSRGYIGIPLIGHVKAKGLTPVQLEKEIADKLSRYLEEPLVSVFVREYKAQKIGVMGAVTSPQVYAVTGQKRLIDMLSMAGGLKREAGNICYVLRPVVSEETQNITRTETIVVDLNELLEKGNVVLNIPVFSGDVINVPKGGVVFVDGAVAKPGVFQMQGKTTLVQTIAMAGGIAYEADRADITVYRDNGEGLRETIAADYDAIQGGQRDDIVLRENDIVIVPKDGVKNFLSGFINTIKGLVSFGFGKTVY